MAFSNQKKKQGYKLNLSSHMFTHVVPLAPCPRTQGYFLVIKMGSFTYR